MASPSTVYTGFWVDRSFSSEAFGATLTLPLQQANYLVTFLALLVTICASFFWTIVAFILHQILARKRTVDVLDLQRQNVLRNAGSPTAAVWQSTKLLLAWRKDRPAQLLQRVLIIVIPAALVWTLFIISGIFVAEVATKDGEHRIALAKEDSCGSLNFDFRSSAALAAYSRKTISDTIQARQYAQNWS